MFFFVFFSVNENDNDFLNQLFFLFLRGHLGNLTCVTLVKAGIIPVIEIIVDLVG